MVRTPNLRAGALTGRRQFLRRLAASGVALAAVRTTWAAGDARRTVSFVHTHTGEELTANYYLDGAYCADVLQQVNVLLRDFRNDTVYPIDPLVLDRLYALHSAAGGSEPFQVISGYRSAVTNAALREKSSGVAEHSLHLEGRAIDVRLAGVASERLARIACRQASGGVGFYRVSDFVHVDTGRVRVWGDSIDS